MAYGDNNYYYRGSGGYRPSSNNRIKRRRNKKRIRNRIIIVLTGLVVCIVAVSIVVGLVRLVFGIGSSPEKISPEATATTAVKANTESKTQKKEKAKLSFVTPKINDDKKSKGDYDTESGIFVWNKTGFELFYGSDDKAQEYGELMNTAKKKLGKNINVYSMIIPNHTEMGLPARFKNQEGGVSTNSQADYINTAYKAMGSDINFINTYNTLAQHCNDYIYFKSDHHWTGLGAYYAYEAFTEQTKQSAIALSDMQENKIEGFTGSFTSLTDMLLDVDTVNFWSMPFDVHNTVTQNNGNVFEAETLYYWAEEPGSNTYGVFLFGDNAKEVIKSSSENASAEKIAIVHESYGNALVPYFTSNYSEVHSIDFRYFTGNLKTYCEENGIKNVLFANGIMSSATETQLESIRSILG